jgi:hypothetical protein
MKTPAGRALLITAVTAGLLGLLHLLGVGLKLLFILACVTAVITIFVPWIGANWLGDIITFTRGRFWARDQGQFHSFGGVPLHIADDGHHVWMDGHGYMRAVGKREAEDVLAARLAGSWQRDAKGQLLLRVDAVVLHLNTMPGREDPRVQRLRRYLEREVLYPASKRHGQGTR